jgi:hypothetical protein
MSVLPSSATLASFFIVFTILFLLTILLGLNLSRIILRFHPHHIRSSISDISTQITPVKLFAWITRYVNSYLSILSPFNNLTYRDLEKGSILYGIPRMILRNLPIVHAVGTVHVISVQKQPDRHDPISLALVRERCDTWSVNSRLGSVSCGAGFLARAPRYLFGRPLFSTLQDNSWGKVGVIRRILLFLR